MGAYRYSILWLALWLGVACTGPQAPSGATDRSAGPAQPGDTSGPKRITIAITAEPPSLYYALIPSPIRAGPGSIQEIVHPGVAVFDNLGTLRPVLVERVPSIENGLWKVLPDGRMETSWTLRPGAQWQDGVALTAKDLVFTVHVVRDRELAVFKDRVSDIVESVDSPGGQTVTIRWKRPLIDADTMFGMSAALPMPSHLLDRAYEESKATFTELPYWTSEFVGAGPFRLREWARGSHLVLAANEQYVLGRPRLDEIEVRFIADGNTLISNLLAGSVDLTLRQALSVDQALQVRDQWRDGQVLIAADGWAVVYPQFVSPTPPIILNVQFRKALLQAIDRQQLADTLMAGLLPIAHSPLGPDTPEYQATEAGIARYEYDPQRAAQMIEGLGYGRGPDGIFRDTAGQKLAFETRASAQRDLHVKTLFPVVDYWQRLGASVESLVIPAQRATDREEQATFPAFQVLRQPSGRDRLVAYHSQEARLPERNFTGNNNGRYMNPELDVLIDRFVATIPPRERMEIAAQIVRHITDQLPVLPLYFDATPSLVHNRLQNVTALSGSEDARQAWNSHEWDVR
jgi:peptide/nickel transport system substrate-binding protein